MSYSMYVSSLKNISILTDPTVFVLDLIKNINVYKSLVVCMIIELCSNLPVVIYSSIVFHNLKKISVY